MNPYDHDAPCPKCRFIAGTTEYHDGFQWSETCPLCSDLSVRARNAARIPGFGYGPLNDEMREELAVIFDGINAEKAAIPEHFDRACPNCKHIWVEGLPND